MELEETLGYSRISRLPRKKGLPKAALWESNMAINKD
jgi:hypothetical protein